MTLNYQQVFKINPPKTNHFFFTKTKCNIIKTSQAMNSGNIINLPLRLPFTKMTKLLKVTLPRLTFNSQQSCSSQRETVFYTSVEVKKALLYTRVDLTRLQRFVTILKSLRLLEGCFSTYIVVIFIDLWCSFYLVF